MRLVIYLYWQPTQPCHTKDMSTLEHLPLWQLAVKCAYIIVLVYGDGLGYVEHVASIKMNLYIRIVYMYTVPPQFYTDHHSD